ncbi:norbelladine synthase-like [Salvia miltiorrhiza]|uniref:norbelladine synthase-like n=1 Tax=Salvia miltiorrhiza TaxID=226208 RepID=UPI0025ACE632|nr:norbelladine synthase-like [Salvia miltiorrhiza]
MMSGTISNEKTVNVPASEAWKLYDTLQLAKIMEEALPSLISKIDVVQGDGGAETVLELFFAPGMEGGLKSYKEKFTVEDEEKRVKEMEVVEGGYMEMGFTVYRVRLEVMEVDMTSVKRASRISNMNYVFLLFLFFFIIPCNETPAFHINSRASENFYGIQLKKY